MRKLTFAMNVTLDGYVAAPGGDLGWGVPSDELFQWWSDRVGATDLARLVTGDAVAEITRLKAEDGGPMDICGATLAGAAMQAGLIDEYVLVTNPVLVGSGQPFFAVLDTWVNLTLAETRAFPGGVLMTRYETQR